MSFGDLRKRLKANAFVSHLEFALQRYYPHDPSLAEHHLGEAVKAMAKMRKAGAESIIRNQDWAYIVRLATELTGKLESSGSEELARDAHYILEHSTQKYTNTL